MSIYPFNDEYFALTESPFIHKIDPKTLETLQRVDLTEKIGVLTCTAHPHVMSDGTLYNLGMSTTKLGPVYNIICFPKGEKIFEDAHVVAKLPSRRKFNPSYMHSFGITENFFIIVEQPLSMSVKKMYLSRIFNRPIDSSLVAFENENTFIHLIDRTSGKLKKTFQTENFYFFHIINQFEKDSHAVIDICSFKDPDLINCMYIESMEKGLANPFNATLKSRPLRFVLPLNDEMSESRNGSENNCVTLENSKATAFVMPNKTIFCKPELLCDNGCELPRINYEKFNGHDYQFFYAMGPSAEGGKVNLIKVDVLKKTSLTWGEINCYPSEPVFVAAPGSEAEDDGVVLASLVWGNGEENRVGLLVLDAKTMKELGRSEFNDLPGPVPKCFHGCFAEGK